MRGKSTYEGKVNLSQGGSPLGQSGEYTWEGKVDLGEGTVSERKLGHDDNHHRHLCLHPPPPPPPNNNLNSKKISFVKCELKTATDRLDLISRGKSFHDLRVATEKALFP